jgi:hypothetical protein
MENLVEDADHLHDSCCSSITSSKNAGLHRATILLDMMLYIRDHSFVKSRVLYMDISRHYIHPFNLSSAMLGGPSLYRNVLCPGVGIMRPTPAGMGFGGRLGGNLLCRHRGP